jgi:hypothetical protein
MKPSEYATLLHQGLDSILFQVEQDEHQYNKFSQFCREDRRNVELSPNCPVEDDNQIHSGVQYGDDKLRKLRVSQDLKYSVRHMRFCSNLD